MHAYQPERLEGKTFGAGNRLGFVKQNKALTAGAALSLLVMGTVFANAIWYQPGKHPSPLFSTRTAQETVETAKVKTKSEPSLTISAPAEVPASKASADLLREIQTALSVRGYYDGKLDGVYGSRTDKAISTFQSDQGLTVDGEPTVRLLTQVLLSASSRPQEVPLPKQPEIDTKPAEVKTVAVKPVQPVTAQPDGLVAQIQSGLKAYGYDELVVDGKMGANTATAIQRFQLDYGMKITGEPSDQVLQKLQDIGAYKQG